MLVEFLTFLLKEFVDDTEVPESIVGMEGKVFNDDDKSKDATESSREGYDFLEEGKKSLETGHFSLYLAVNVEWRNSPPCYEEADDQSELTAGTF